MRRVKEAQQKELGGGIVCRRFSFLYPDGPAPYYSIMAPSSHANSLEAYTMLHDVASNALNELGATITHHHAVGKTFREFYDKEVDPVFRRVLGAAKTELDPTWMLNPGLLLDRPTGAKAPPLKIVG